MAGRIFAGWVQQRGGRQYFSTAVGPVRAALAGSGSDPNTLAAVSAGSTGAPGRASSPAGKDIHAGFSNHALRLGAYRKSRAWNLSIQITFPASPNSPRRPMRDASRGRKNLSNGAPCMVLGDGRRAVASRQAGLLPHAGAALRRAGRVRPLIWKIRVFLGGHCRSLAGFLRHGRVSPSLSLRPVRTATPIPRARRFSPSA